MEAVFALERELGVSHPLAQVLVRRGLGAADAARAWLAADERHDPADFAGIDAATALVLGHVRRAGRITIHGDYDVDGVSSTAILVGVLRTLGADVDWFLPSRAEDGYGLSAATVQRLAQLGTRLLITADCAITAVDEVAAALAAGMEVVVTDHHSPRADGGLPAAPIVHPAVCGYPCADLCAAGVAYKLAAALLSCAGEDPALGDRDLDSLHVLAEQQDWVHAALGAVRDGCMENGDPRNLGPVPLPDRGSHFGARELRGQHAFDHRCAGPKRFERGVVGTEGCAPCLQEETHEPRKRNS